MNQLKLNQEQINLLQHALGLAEKHFTDLHVENIKAINVRKNENSRTQAEAARWLHVLACDLSDLNNEITNQINK